MSGSITVTAPNKLTVIKQGVNLVRLKAKETRQIPASMLEAALAEGCDTDAKASADVKEKAAETVVKTEERQAAILAGIKSLMDKGDTALLTQSGEPRARELEQAVGFDTDADERNIAWEQYQAQLGDDEQTGE